MTASPRTPTRRWALVALVLFPLFFGVFFRCYGLGEKLVWHDEVATRILAAGYTTGDRDAEIYSGAVVTVEDVLRYQHHNPERSVIDAVRDLALHDPQHPPLYYVIARGWVRGFGDGIGTLRALSVVFSLLCFPAMYWLAFELSRSRRVAWMSVVLGAVSPLLILYAQEAREYALWCAFIVLSSAALLRAIRLTEAGREPPAGLSLPRDAPAKTDVGASAGEARAVDDASAEGESSAPSPTEVAASLPTPPRSLALAWATYSLCIVLGFYTSFSTTSVVLAHIVYIVVRERLRVNRVSLMAAAALAVSGAAFLPWALNLARNFEAFQASMKWSSAIVIPRTALVRILSLNVSRTIVDLWPEAEQVEIIPILVAATATALVVVALVFVALRTRRQTSVLVLALVIVPIAMLLIPDLAFGGIRSISGRYMMPAWIGVQLALALLLGTLMPTDRRSAPRKAITAAVVVIGLISGASNARRVATWPKGVSLHLPEVAAWINRAPATLIVGNEERHNRGNLLALANLLRPGSLVQLVPIGTEMTWTLPPHPGDVYLFCPTDQFRRRLEERSGVRTRLVEDDIFLQLWIVEPPEAP